MTDEIALLNRLYQKSRKALSQRLAYKNEKFVSVVKEAIDNPDCLVCGPMIHVLFDEISAADDIPLPFQVAMHSKRGLGVLRWDTFEDAVAARGETIGAIPRAKFYPAKDCDLSTQAIIDLESLELQITMTRNLSSRLATRAN
jgi:hypothetical protein